MTLFKLWINKEVNDKMAFNIYLIPVNAIQIMVHFLLKDFLFFLTSCVFELVKGRHFHFFKQHRCQNEKFPGDL